MVGEKGESDEEADGGQDELSEVGDGGRGIVRADELGDDDVDGGSRAPEGQGCATDEGESIEVDLSEDGFFVACGDCTPLDGPGSRPDEGPCGSGAEGVSNVFRAEEGVQCAGGEFIGSVGKGKGDPVGCGDGGGEEDDAEAVDAPSLDGLGAGAWLAFEVFASP